MPATTTTASAEASSSAASRMRWRPATPTSVIRRGRRPWATRVAAHSSATGRSAVPAVTTATRSGRSAAGRHTTVCRRRSAASPPPASTTVPSGLAARAAATWSASARDSTIGERAGLGEQLGHDGRALRRRLARAVDRLGHALAQRAVVVDPGVPEVGEGQPSQGGDGVVGADRTGLHRVEKLPEGGLVHPPILPDPRPHRAIHPSGSAASRRMVTDTEPEARSLTALWLRRHARVTDTEPEGGEAGQAGRSRRVATAARSAGVSTEPARPHIAGEHLGRGAGPHAAEQLGAVVDVHGRQHHGEGVGHLVGRDAGHERRRGSRAAPRARWRPRWPGITTRSSRSWCWR